MDDLDKSQVLLEQAEGCIDAALDHILRTRDILLSCGISAYTLGSLNAKLAGTIGELHTCRRLLPGYKRNGDGMTREEG